MNAATLPCPTCACTGEDTHEDRHAGTNQDTCRTCAGTGFIPARTGETAEASFRPARVFEPGERAYLARYAGMTLGPNGAAPRWEDLQACGRATWARVEQACTTYDREENAKLREALAVYAAQDHVQVDYTNHEGVRGLRTITPLGAYFGTCLPWHPEPQWLIPCIDHDRDAVRVYAQAGVHAWDGVPVSGWSGIQADEARIAAWVADRFGPASVINARERADRLLEEAIEMHQAVYAEENAWSELDGIDKATKLIEHVYSKEPGDPRQEMGGVMTCALALGHRLGVRLDLTAQAELTRIEGLSKAHFDKRHQAKVDAGVAAQHVRPAEAEGRAP